MNRISHQPHRPPSPAGRDLVTRPVEVLSRIVRRAPRLVVCAVLAVTALLLLVSGQAEEATQNEGMMPDVPEVEAANVISDRFGSTEEETLQIVVRSEGATLVSADGYHAATAIEQALRSSDHADRIVDLDDRPGVLTWAFPAQQAFADTDPGELDDGQVREAYTAALASMPADHAGIADTLLPHDADHTTADRALAVVFTHTSGLDGDPEVYFDQLLEIQTDLADVVTAADLPAGVSVEVFSPHLLYADADAAFESEIGRLFGAAFLLIVLILAFVYWVRPGLGMSRVRSGRRSIADVLLSMSAIVMAVLWMTGAAVLLGPDHLDVVGRMTEFTQVIPILLIGLGVDYAIHLTSRYREELGGGATVSAAVDRAAGTVGGALVLATATTAIGFLTNIVNPIPALRDFGILAAVGIVSAFVLMLTFVPAARLLLDRRAERAGRLPVAALGQSSERVLPKLMGRTAVLAEKAPIATIAVTVLLAGVGLYGMTQLETRFSSTDFVPEDTPALDTFTTLTDDFDGGVGETTDVLIRGDVTEPAVHNALVATHENLADIDHVVVHDGHAAAMSPVTVMTQLLAPDVDGQPASPEFASTAMQLGMDADLTVPTDADLDRLYAQLAEIAPDATEPLLAAGGRDLDTLRVQVATSAGEAHTEDLARALDEVFAPVATAGAEVVVTSPTIQEQAVVTALQDSQASSLAITLLVAMLLLVAVFAYQQRRPALGVLTTVPVILVVLWTFGTMAATGIPFGPITATIAALAIGIGLPYAIHVTHRFTEDRAQHHEVGAAIRATVQHAGGAMAGSAFTTITGFGILVTSTLVPFRQLGAVTVYAVGYSLLAATLVLPSLLVLWDRWHHRHTHPELTTSVPEAAPQPVPA